MYAPEVLQKKEPRAAKEEPRRPSGARRAPRACAPCRARGSVPPPRLNPSSTLARSAATKRASRSVPSSRVSLSTWIPLQRSRSTRARRAATRSISRAKLGALIGRRGETLDAIQRLTNYSINRGSEKNRVRVQVDAENYREKREQSLERLAEKVAGKVTKISPQRHPRADECLRAPCDPHRAPGYAGRDHLLHRHRAEQTCCCVLRPYQGVKFSTGCGS